MISAVARYLCGSGTESHGTEVALVFAERPLNGGCCVHRVDKLSAPYLSVYILHMHSRCSGFTALRTTHVTFVHT
jgi:hypothetical protein